jgi:hypothetical protein
MAYQPPLDWKRLAIACEKFRRYQIVSLVFVITIVASMFFLHHFWRGKLVWSVGSLITLHYLIGNRFFDIKKTANKNAERIDLANLPPDERNFINNNLALENFFSYAWLAGTVLLVVSKWFDY